MPVDALTAHVERFNEGVRSGNYSAMLAALSDDAELVFAGVPVGPFVGRKAIADAYRTRPPDDEIRLLTGPRVENGALVADYAWLTAGTRAGTITLSERDGAIMRLVVTFD
jgi:steroid delta-isomerase